MKFIVGLLFIGAIAAYIFFPMVNSERLCYEESQKLLDRISVNVLNQRMTKDMECSGRTDILFALEDCIKEATRSSTVAQYTNDAVMRIVALLRPYGKNLWLLKEEHNNACSDFSWYQLP